MRQGMLIGGVIMLVAGVACFMGFVVAAGQAAADLTNCMNTNPAFTFPSACSQAMSAMWFDQAMEGVGGLLVIVGIIVMVIGFVLEPHGPAPAVYAPPPAAYYPPPVYAPQPVAPPPQGPPSPPQP